MLGLVSYEGSSDEDDCDSAEEKPPGVSKQNTIDSHISDEEDDLRIPSSTPTLNKEIKSGTQLNDSISDNLDSIQVSNDDSTVFSQLPAPTSHSLNSLAGVVSSGVSKTKGQSSVKITIPSLDEFDDVDEDLNEPKKTKIKASLKGSGLFSILPKPRHEFLATPRNVPSTSCTLSNNKSIPSTLVPRQIAKTKIKTPPKKKCDLIEYDSNESDDDSLADDNFFTIPAAEERQDNVVPDKNIEEYMKPIVQDTPKADMVSNGLPEQGPSTPPSEADCVSYPSFEPSTPSFDGSVELNDEVIRKLGGRKRKGEDVKLIEVDGSALMPEPGEWLTKQLSQETAYKPSCKKGTGPTSQQKRKHQITYLAFQAKANELDLKNQWANNRQSKRQTQSKYGF